MDEWEYRGAADRDLTPGESTRSILREPGLPSKLTQSLWRGLTGAYLRGMHRLTVHGREHIPAAAPFVLVANHASHLDALSLAAALPYRLRHSAFPVAAGDTFFETPATAYWAAMMVNALPMWRGHAGRHALEYLRERLIEQPAIYILFPEGTRSRDGNMARFKAGLGMLVAGTPIPVVPCHIRGAFEALPPDRTLPRFTRVTVRIGPGLEFEGSPNTKPGWRQVAEQSEAAVRNLAAS